MAGWTRLSPAFTSLRCRQAASQGQQRGLLTLLPAIRNGSLDVNTFPRADNRTALHLARGPGSRQTVDWLLKNNASQIYVDSHGSPFMCTTDDNGPAIRKLLVQQSALGCPGMPDIIPASGCRPTGA